MRDICISKDKSFSDLLRKEWKSRKFVLCPFVYEETRESYPFANGLSGLNGLSHNGVLEYVAFAFC
jgi:hypothetical protein